jgi:hypothetical protein
VYLKLVNINTLSFEPNNTGKLNVNQLKLTFNVGEYEWVGSSLNYEISNGIYKMLYLFIYLFTFLININIIVHLNSPMLMYQKILFVFFLIIFIYF